MVEIIAILLVAGAGFETCEAFATDLQSAPIGRSGNLPVLVETSGSGAKDSPTMIISKPRESTYSALGPHLGIDSLTTAGLKRWQNYSHG